MGGNPVRAFRKTECKRAQRRWGRKQQMLIDWSVDTFYEHLKSKISRWKRVPKWREPEKQRRNVHNFVLLPTTSCGTPVFGCWKTGSGKKHSERSEAGVESPGSFRMTELCSHSLSKEIRQFLQLQLEFLLSLLSLQRPANNVQQDKLTRSCLIFFSFYFNFELFSCQ